MQRGLRMVVLSLVFQGVLLMTAQVRADVTCSADCRSGEAADCVCHGSGCSCDANESVCFAVCSSTNCEDVDECEGPVE
jgi:hypothetical protein